MNKSEKRYCILPVAGAAIIILIFIIMINYGGKRIIDDVSSFVKNAGTIERKIILNVPMYEDYATSAREAELRRYLLRYHLEAARKYGVKGVQDLEDIKDLCKDGSLVSIEASDSDNYYFYNVRKNLRFLSPAAATGLRKLTNRFQENLTSRGVNAQVKIAISSAVRPVSYQKKLRGRNPNASVKSSHSYGISFDIFFDDFYVVLPESGSYNWISEEINKKVRRRLGFLMGDALRRQLRSVLMETIIQMQDTGEIYAILERKQHCYHVTVLGH